MEGLSYPLSSELKKCFWRLAYTAPDVGGCFDMEGKQRRETRKRKIIHAKTRQHPMQISGHTNAMEGLTGILGLARVTNSHRLRRWLFVMAPYASTAQILRVPSRSRAITLNVPWHWLMGACGSCHT